MTGRPRAATDGWLALAILSTTLMTTPVHAQTQHGPAAATAATVRARFATERGTLVLVEESHALPLVDFVVALRTGSAADPVGKEGVARLTARMTRMGTAQLTGNDVEERIDALGASLSIETTPSTTRFSGTVIARNVEPLLALLGGLLAQPALRANDLEQVRRESIADVIDARDDDRGLAGRAFREAVFAGHVLARRSLGTRTSLGAITHDDIAAQWRAQYVARNMVIGLAGDVTEARARALVRAAFASVRDGAAPEVVIGPPPVLPAGRHVVIVDKPQRTQTQIFIGGLGTEAHDPDHFALVVANTVFGGTFTSRLMREVRSVRGWSYGAASRLYVERVREAFSLWTFPATADALPCVQLELTLLAALLEGGITQAELDFAKSYLANSWAFEVDTAAKRLDQRLDVELLGLPADYYDGYIARVRAVTLAQANAALRARLSATDLVIAITATAADVRDGLAALPGVTHVDVVPFDQD